MTTTRERKAEWARRRRRLVAYGKWEPTPMVDADPARHHVNSLRDFGISVPTIERLAGEGKGQMAQLIYGNQKTITAKRADRILAIRFDLDAIPPTKLVDASGTRRRIEALMCNGWSYTHIGRLIGGSRQLVTKHHNAKHVTAATARTIRDVYGLLWDQPGPEPRAVNKARREGFAPPLAWDDDSIDDPHAIPDTSSQKRPGGKTVHIDELEWLIQQHPLITTNELAERFGVTRSAVQHALEPDRGNRPDLLARLARNAEVAA